MNAFVAMLAGPPVAGVLVTSVIDGRAGLRELLARLLRWRVAGRWYAAAFLPAPVLGAAVLFALSLGSPVYLPAIVTTAERGGLLLAGLAVGLVGGLVEELGWTGVAITRLRPCHGLFKTALVVGGLWSAWHLLQMMWVGNTSSAQLPLALFFGQYFFTALAALTAYRVLMVWVYDRTESLLMAVLMHASYIFTTLFALAPPTTGVAFLTYAWMWAAALWLVVVILAVATRWTVRGNP
jgi:uncharacterized protein